LRKVVQYIGGQFSYFKMVGE